MKQAQTISATGTEKAILSARFDSDKREGSLGEALVWRRLSRQKSVAQVIDVREDLVFQDMDVDFLLQMTDKTFRWVEVKMDKAIHATGNIAYELESNGKIGCFEKTRAQIVIYYDAVGMVGYMIDTEKARAIAHSGDYELRGMGDASKGYLIPIADLIKKGAVKAQWCDK